MYFTIRLQYSITDGVSYTKAEEHTDLRSPLRGNQPRSHWFGI